MQREITSIFGERKVVLRHTQRAVTAYGGLSVFVEYPRKIGYAERVSEHMPVQYLLRKNHRTTGFLEDANFRIRDQETWLRKRTEAPWLREKIRKAG